MGAVVVVVEAEDAGGQLGHAARDPVAKGLVGHGAVRQVEVDRGGGTRTGAGLVLVTRRLEPHEGRTGLDLPADPDEDLLDPCGEGSRQHGLHLHRLEDEDRGARRHLVAHLHGGSDDEGRGGGAEHAALVAGHPVGDAVDLDEEHRTVQGGDEAVVLATDDDAALVVVDPVELGLDDLAVVSARPRPDRDPVAVRGDAQDVDLVDRAPQLEVHAPADLVVRLRAAAASGLEQAGALDRLGLLVGLDAGCHEGDPGVALGHEAPLAAHPVDPAGVGGAVDDLRLVEEVEDEALVRRPALDDHRRLGHRPAQPRQGLVTVAAVGDDLGDHRVEVGGDRVALSDARVDPDARTGGEVEQRDTSRGGGEVTVGVLGVEPRLDGVAPLDRTRSLQATAVRDVDLQLDEVRVGRRLGDRVLHLEAGVHLEEGEELLGRVVEELDGPGPRVADRHREPFGRGAHLGCLVGREHGGCGLLDDLLVAALHGAVPDADGPRRALPVADDLDLDVAGAGDELLEEDDAGAEGARRLVTSSLVGLGQLGVRLDLADPAPTPAGGGLEHEGVADPARGLRRLLERVDAAARPRRHRDADLLGDELGADLVAELAHRLGARTDEGDPDPLAQLGEGRVLGDEAPADPRGVRSGLAQRALENRVVDVGPVGGRAEVVGVVALADEHGATLTLGVQRDRLDPLLGPPLHRVLGVEVADGVDEPHGGLAAVDDRDARDHGAVLLRSPGRAVTRDTSRRSLSPGAGYGRVHQPTFGGPPQRRPYAAEPAQRHP